MSDGARSKSWIDTQAPSARSVHRPVKACTECKQVKLRCDSKAKFPAPCSRCHTKNLQCVVDSSFRRTPARKRVEDMARELEKLKSLKSEDHRPESIVPSFESGLSVNSAELPSKASEKAILDDSGIDLDNFQLGTFVIDKDTVVDIFTIFTIYLYPHFPIISSSISIANIHATSPLLFWTILAVVVGHELKPLHTALLQQIQDPFLAKFRNEILTAPVPLETIQAAAYLIMFPLPAERQTHDPSWLYCGAAMNAALYMGLHRPKPPQSLRSIGVVAGPARARASTWLGCFLANTMLSLTVGVPPLINTATDLNTIERFIAEYPVPTEFAFQVAVQHTIAKFASVVSEDSRDSINHSLVRLIVTELDTLKSKHHFEWTPRAEVTLLVAKLHLYAWTVIRIQETSASRELVLKQGYTVALRIVHLVSQGLHYTTSNYTEIEFNRLPRALPKHYFRGTVLAAIFLLRYFSLNSLATPEEREISRNHVAIAHAFFNNRAVHHMDEGARAARLFETLSRQQPSEVDISKLRIEDRMGVSIVFDAISTGHDLKNIPAELEEGPQASNFNRDTESQKCDVGSDPQNFDFNSFDTMVPIDFTQPEDIWGDSIWGMFDLGFGPPQN